MNERGGHGRSIARSTFVFSIAIAVAVLGCQSASTAAPTGTSSITAAAPTPAAVASTPSHVAMESRPPGVPADAKAFHYGCTPGASMCTNMAAGAYYTEGRYAFLPGLTFTLPTGWSSLGNEAGELELYPDAGGGGSEILIWRDLVPWIDGRAVVDAATDPRSWVERLASDPRLVVSSPKQVVLGQWLDARSSTGTQTDLGALAVTVGISKRAANEMQDCPGTACIQIFTDATHWEEPFDIGRDQMDGSGCPCTVAIRLYLASIGDPSNPHLFVVALQTYGPNDTREASLAELEAAAQPVLDSLVIPAVIVDN